MLYRRAVFSVELLQEVGRADLLLELGAVEGLSSLIKNLLKFEDGEVDQVMDRDYLEYGASFATENGAKVMKNSFFNPMLVNHHFASLVVDFRDVSCGFYLIF